ncbi:hypothetical protein [Geminicoccus roseus]|uniref:hypothetical protein n=1 Tax=Geminicoccus roseus TaxID=404900 RepID=UPI000481CE2A|nr:hypothetical protein [Geminicoccus roseus]
MSTKFDEDAYEHRWWTFVGNMIEIRRSVPRRRYLYALMDTVAFQDTETAIDLTLLQYRAEKSRRRKLRRTKRV